MIYLSSKIKDYFWKKKKKIIQLRKETKSTIVENVEVQEPQNSSNFDQCTSGSMVAAREESKSIAPLETILTRLDQDEVQESLSPKQPQEVSIPSTPQTRGRINAKSVQEEKENSNQGYLDPLGIFFKQTRP